MYEFVTGKRAWSFSKDDNNNNQEVNPLQIIMKAALQNKRPEFPETTPHKLKSIIEKSWSINPNDRPTCSELMSYFTELQQNDYNLTMESEPLECTLTFIPDQ